MLLQKLSQAPGALRRWRHGTAGTGPRAALLPDSALHSTYSGRADFSKYHPEYYGIVNEVLPNVVELGHPSLRVQQKLSFLG